MKTPTKKDAQALAYHNLAHDLYLVVLDFMPNIGQCALQDYGRLNSALIQAEKIFGRSKKGT